MFCHSSGILQGGYRRAWSGAKGQCNISRAGRIAPSSPLHTSLDCLECTFFCFSAVSSVRRCVYKAKQVHPDRKAWSTWVISLLLHAAQLHHITHGMKNTIGSLKFTPWLTFKSSGSLQRRACNTAALLRALSTGKVSAMGHLGALCLFIFQ